MNQKPKFHQGQIVRSVLNPHCKLQITEIVLREGGAIYRCTYFDDTTIREAYLFPLEIEAVESDKKIGFTK